MQFEILEDGDLLNPQPSFADQYASAVMRQESAFNPRAVSPAGAQGLMQIMPATGREVAQKLGMQNFDPFNAEQNQIVGKAYLNQMYEQFQDPQLALAAYNAGPGRVQQAIQRAGTNDPQAVLQFLPRETQNYVPKVQGNFNSNYGAPNIQQPKLTVQNVVKPQDFEIIEDGDKIDILEDGDAAPPPPPEMGWKDYARGIVGQGVQGLTFNWADDVGAVDKNFQKQFEAQYPKAAIGSQIAGGLAPAAVSYVASLFSGGAAAPAAAATTASTAANVSRLASLLKGGARVAAGLGPKTAATTGLGRAAQGVGYGALYGGLSGAGEGENAGEKIAGAIRGSAFGGVAGGALSGLTGALTKTKGPDLSEGDKLLIKRLRSVPDDVIQGAETTLRQADQPVFLPEAIGTKDFYDEARTIANSAGTKDIAQKAIQSRYNATPARTKEILNDVAPDIKPWEAGAKLKQTSEDIEKSLKLNRNEVAQATYGPVYQATPNVPEELAAEMLRSKNAKRAANKVRASREFMDRPDTDTEFLHAVKSNLENTAKETANASIKRGLDKDANYFKSVLNENVPGMSAADLEYSKLSQNIDEITKNSLLGNLLDRQNLNVGTFGKKLLDSKTSPNEIKKLINDLGENGEDLVFASIRAELADQVDNRVGGKNTVSIFDKEALKDRLTDILGEEKASKVIKKIDEEVLISEGTTKYRIGSPTQPAQEGQLLEDFQRDPFKYYGKRGLTSAAMDALSVTLGKFINPSRQALQDEAAIIFSNSKAADALARALQSNAAQRQSQQSYESLAPLIYGLSRNANEIPVIEIKNSYRGN